MRKYKNYIFIVLIALLTLKVFIPQLDDLQDSLAALKEANLYWMGLALVVYFSAVPIMAYQFMLLTFKKLVFWMTFRVQMAGLFVNKLLPAGLGSVSLNMFYFIKVGHSANKATTIVTMDAIASAIAFILLIVAALITSSITLKGLQGDVHIPVNLVLFLLIILVGIMYYVYKSVGWRSKIKAAWLDFKANIKEYKTRPRSVVLAVFTNGLVSLANLAVLYLSAKAVGIDITFAEALLAYSFGNIAATLVPTPGGIGSTEAGLYSGLVLVGIDGANAILITMLYRLVSYWIPILPGYYFFWGLRKNLLADYSIKKQPAN